MELPAEDSDDGRCGLLKKAIRGTRDAAKKWEMEYTKMLVDTGSRQGACRACVFFREQTNVRIETRGDDFTVLGTSTGLDWLRGVTQSRMEVKLKARFQRGQGGAVRITTGIVLVTESGVG